MIRTNFVRLFSIVLLIGLLIFTRSSFITPYKFIIALGFVFALSILDVVLSKKLEKHETKLAKKDKKDGLFKYGSYPFNFTLFFVNDKKLLEMYSRDGVNIHRSYMRITVVLINLFNIVLLVSLFF